MYTFEKKIGWKCGKQHISFTNMDFTLNMDFWHKILLLLQAIYKKRFILKW